MVRHTHGTPIARLMAACLLVLTAAAVSSSLLLEPSDFGHARPASTSQHSPVRDTVEALVRVGPNVVITAPLPTPAKVPVLDERGAIAVRPIARANGQRIQRSVLRL